MVVAEDMVAEFVSRTMDRATLDARPGKPDREAMRSAIGGSLNAVELGV